MLVSKLCFFQIQSHTLLRPQAYDRMENGISGESRKRKMILNPHQGLQASYFITNRASSISINEHCSQNQLISFWSFWLATWESFRKQKSIQYNLQYRHITAHKPQANPNRSDHNVLVCSCPKQTRRKARRHVSMQAHRHAHIQTDCRQTKLKQRNKLTNKQTNTHTHTIQTQSRCGPSFGR